MRYLVVPIAAVLSLLVPGLALAQPPIAKIEKVRVGFKPYNENINFARYKVGLWTPVYVEVTAGQNGLGALPGEPQAYLKIVTPDFEGVETIYRTPVRIDPNETRVIVGYTKTGNTSGDIKIDLKVGNRTIHSPPERPMGMELGGHVYLALGRRVSDLPSALRPREDKKDDNNAQFRDFEQRRAAVFEENADLLPRQWFGYDGIDAIFLSTDNRKFLETLGGKDGKEQLKALAQWVRRGGRLVIPVSRQTQELVHNLLTQGAWQPPVPIVPPVRTEDNFRQPDRLPSVARWGEVNAPLPNPGEKPPVVAQLAPPDANASDWEVEERAGDDGPPLIARMRYGLGQIVYFAFSLDDPALTQWPARTDFLRKAITKLAPRSGQDAQHANQPMRSGRGGQDMSDVSSQLFNQLDNFDVQVIPFAIVAAFILLYVIIVGPLEFVLLKYVFGRLEWTWITFPAVVIGVSVIAYFGAYALKGQDLKINKVDVVDFDLRSDPRMPRAYGQTYLMILSPRIQSYTVGIEPNPAFWGEEPATNPLSADVVSWMARPEADNFGGMGSGAGGQGFFRKPYYYGAQDPGGAPREETLPTGVSGVPIPVWMSKAFTAAWEAPTKVPPVVADLAYHRQPVEGRDLKITGTLRSNLAVELVDTWLFYGGKVYPIKSGLPAARDGGAIKVQTEEQQGLAPSSWFGQSVNVDGNRPNTNQGTYDPTSVIKQMLFHEQFDTTRNLANHSQRRIDLSWRLTAEPPQGQVDRRTREAILVGRLRFRTGGAEDLTGDSGHPLPTRLWLGGLPSAGDPRSRLDGTMNQDTFVRVILPVKPAGN